MSKQEDTALYHVFGRQPVTKTIHVFDIRDTAGEGEEHPGIAIVFHALSRAENLQWLHSVGEYGNEIEQDGAWTTEGLARAIDSANGIAMPEDMERRRQVIRSWPDYIVATIAEAFRDFQDECRDIAGFVERSPNPSGATSGRESAPRGVGAAES